MIDTRPDDAIKFESIGLTLGEWRNLSAESKREADMTDGAVIRWRAGLADDRDLTIIAYSRFSPNVPKCHHRHA